MPNSKPHFLANVRGSGHRGPLKVEVRGRVIAGAETLVEGNAGVFTAVVPTEAARFSGSPARDDARKWALPDNAFDLSGEVFRVFAVGEKLVNPELDEIRTGEPCRAGLPKGGICVADHDGHADEG